MQSRPSAIADDGRTRDRVSALILEHGPQTATELAGRLGISPAAVRRHLDALVATGRLEERLARGAAPRIAVAAGPPGSSTSPTPAARPSRTPTTTSR